jgi:hypothetical protein
VSDQQAEQPQVCVECRKRPAAYVLDRLEHFSQTLSGQLPRAMFPVWACEDCVPHLLAQVLDVVSIATVCRADAYRP